MKLMIAIPTLDYVHYEFANSLIGLTRRLDELGVDYDVRFKGGTLVYLSRNALALDAIGYGYTHVLWLDTDMVFAPDAFEKLSEHGKDIVSGVYQSRHEPIRSALFERLKPAQTVRKYPDGLFDVEGCGFGIVLTSTKALRDVYRHFGTLFQPIDGFGEDLSFCINARKAGYEIYCDPNVTAGHIGHTVIWPEK